MISNLLLLTFSVAFMGCVLMTPLVTHLAGWLGAIDRPDQFRRVHKGAIPRLGGLGLGFGVGAAAILALTHGDLTSWTYFHAWAGQLAAILAAGILIVAVGLVDDIKGVGPRMKLIGQAIAVLILYFGEVRIDKFTMLGYTLDLSKPGFFLDLGPVELSLAWPSLILTMLWFLGCMNVWNLIDGMDGLASGVGLLVASTLMLVAIRLENIGGAVLAAALCGGLAGFLLYNWHPACIFLGDSGSLLIGMLIGIIGVQGSMKGASAVAILFPILAMGLPITDTAMAIFRRWVRNLPLSAADRRHVHHLLMGLGLNPRQAAIYLYTFSSFLCGVVLLGVALNSEALALGLGVSGCLAFLLILTSRRDELRHLREEFLDRMTRGRQERFAAKATWESIQRIELCNDDEAIWSILGETADRLGCRVDALRVLDSGSLVFERESGRDGIGRADDSGAVASFRLSLPSSGTRLQVELSQAGPTSLATDISFRFARRLCKAGAERIAELAGIEGAREPEPAREPAHALSHAPSPPEALVDERPSRGIFRRWLASRRPSLGPH